MYEVQIINRGPEGVRSYTKGRLTKAGSDELQRRIETNVVSGDRRLTDILLGIELETNDDENGAVAVESVADPNATEPVRRGIGGNPDQPVSDE